MQGCRIIPEQLRCYERQWRSQDTEVTRAQELHAAKGSAQRGVASITLREARKKFFAFIFQLRGWDLRASHCRQSLLSKVS